MVWAPIWLILRLVEIVFLSVMMALSMLLLFLLNSLMRSELLVMRLKTEYGRSVHMVSANLLSWLKGIVTLIPRPMLSPRVILDRDLWNLYSCVWLGFLAVISVLLGSLVALTLALTSSVYGRLLRLGLSVVC